MALDLELYTTVRHKLTGVVAALKCVFLTVTINLTIISAWSVEFLSTLIQAPVRSEPKEDDDNDGYHYYYNSNNNIYGSVCHRGTVVVKVYRIHLLNVGQHISSHTKLTDLGCRSVYNPCCLYPPSPFIVTHYSADIWYSFYRTVMKLVMMNDDVDML